MKKMMVFLFLIFSSTAFAKFDWLKLPEIDQLYSKKRLSIVFASQNLKSPVSMFGHTFLVAHNEMPPEPDAVTIEFLGKTSGSFGQYFNALISHIDGEFRLGKFIIKNREYDFEDRNLWVYELNIPENEKMQVFSLISSVIKNQDFPYTFLNKNCSFYIFNSVIKNSSFKQRSIYTLPKYTIRELKKLGYINKPPVVIETDQSKLINFLKSRDTYERTKINQIIEGYYYSLTDETWGTRRGLDLALTYKIPREPRSEKRTQYFNIKKQLMDIVPRDQALNEENLKRNDPIEVYGDANIRLGYEVKSQAAILEGKFAQRDFYTSRNDGLSNSYLEIMKGKLSFNKDENIKLQQLTVFKLESLIPSGDYNESFNRLIDLSFYKHLYEEEKVANEAVLRYGQGLSTKLGDITFGVIPYLGLRYFNFSSNNSVEMDLGTLTKLNYWLNDTVSIEGSLINHFFTKLPFNYKANIKLATRLNPRWTLGLEGIFYDKNNEAEFSLIYGF